MVDASSLWHDAVDDLRKLEEEASSFDQRAKVVEIKAQLSVAQEISLMNPSNVTTSDEAGNKLNGWGMIVERNTKGGVYWE